MEIGSGSDGEMGAVGMQMSVSYHHHHHGTTSQQPAAAAAAAAALEIGNSNNCNNNNTNNSSSNNNNNNNNNGAQAGNSEHGNGGAGEAAVVTAAAAGVGAGGVLRSSTAGLRSSSGGGSGNIKYRECLKNHAASIGGHANDGCGEFMPSGEEGSLEALKCAACGCHRNFHRRECGDLPSSHHPSCCYFCGPPGKRYGVPLGGPSPSPLALPAPAPRMMLPPESGEHGGGIAGPSVLYAHGGAKKRFRTKFTQEQKDKMCAFAEKLGWRIQKHDDLSVQQFCMEVGVKRHVLKVWMHNNKHTLAKKPS